jgi:hypothetical protein
MDQLSKESSSRGLISLAGQPRLLEYRPRIDMDMVQRLLGIRRRKTLTRTTQRRVDNLYKPLLDCLSPRVIWKIHTIRSVDGAGVSLEDGVFFQSRKMARSLAGADRLVCFVATVGRAVDEMIEAAMSEGDIADSYIMDAMGSGAVECTADTFQNDLVDNMLTQPYDAGLRFSPGYCDWPLAEQEKIFELLDCREIGVTLSDSALMAPRKSVSAVFGLYDKTADRVRPKANPCNNCGKKDCIARRTDTATTSH